MTVRDVAANRGRMTKPERRMGLERDVPAAPTRQRHVPRICDSSCFRHGSIVMWAEVSPLPGDCALEKRETSLLDTAQRVVTCGAQDLNHCASVAGTPLSGSEYRHAT